MRKVKLNLESLAVDSFETDERTMGVGTVLGLSGPTRVEPYCDTTSANSECITGCPPCKPQTQVMEKKEELGN